MADARNRLDRLWRVAASLHPDRPLERGYARIESRTGKLITSGEGARKAGALTLVFAGDDRVEARVERATREGYLPEKPQQGSLL